MAAFVCLFQGTLHPGCAVIFARDEEEAQEYLKFELECFDLERQSEPELVELDEVEWGDGVRVFYEGDGSMEFI